MDFFPKRSNAHTTLIYFGLQERKGGDTKAMRQEKQNRCLLNFSAKGAGKIDKTFIIETIFLSKPPPLLAQP